MLRLPRAAVESWIVPGRGGLGAACSGASGLGRTTAIYARSITDEIEALMPEEGLVALRHLCQLFALAAAGRPSGVEGGQEAWRAARLARIRRYVEENLTAPDLTPARIAAAAGISLRSLHSLFESTGASIAQIITRKRLDRCHAALVANPAGRVADIAFAAGFNDLSTFQRAFKRAYGLSPRELREVARTTSGGSDAPRG